MDRSNVTKYSPGVLVGNWYEEMRVKEDQLDLYKSQRALGLTAGERTGTATMAGLAARDAMVSRLSEATQLSGAAAGAVAFGEPMLILSKKVGGALAIDLGTTPAPNQVGLTVARASTSQVRSSWVIQRCADTDNIAFNTVLREATVLHYGQRVRVINENASERGFLYVHSEKQAGLRSSEPQHAVGAYTASADNVFIIQRPATKRADVLDGHPVQIGDPVVLIHSLTNLPLMCTGETTSTSFGSEYGVLCGYAQSNFGRSQAAVATQDENIFFFSAGAEEDAPKIRGSTMQSSQRNDLTMSMTRGSGVEDVLQRIREGALAFGGRLGFRTLSLALGVACSEQRRTLLDRAALNQRIARIGVSLRPVELDVLVKKFDREGNTIICAQDMMAELRGNMNPDRLRAVVKAHQQLIIEGEGSVDFKDMRNLFCLNASLHPDVLDGLIVREEAILDFESSWPGRIGSKLGTVTLDEFIEYYNDISPATDDEDRFITIVRNTWRIPETDDYRRGEPLRAIAVKHPDDSVETIKLPDSLVLDVNDREAVRRVLVQLGVRDVVDFTMSYRV